MAYSSGIKDTLRLILSSLTEKEETKITVKDLSDHLYDAYKILNEETQSDLFESYPLCSVKYSLDKLTRKEEPKTEGKKT